VSAKILNCRTCTHWKMDMGGPTRIGDPVPGTCLAHPPSLFVLIGPNGPQIRTQYPQPTSHFYACGEYKPDLG
jgi:hypothetical protein